jgi:hypothetical protein
MNESESEVLKIEESESESKSEFCVPTPQPCIRLHSEKTVSVFTTIRTSNYANSIQRKWLETRPDEKSLLYPQDTYLSLFRMKTGPTVIGHLPKSLDASLKGIHLQDSNV